MKKDVGTELTLRDYLLKEVARNNHILSGMMKSAFRSFRNGYNNGYRDIYSSFAGKSQVELEEIYHDIQYYHPSYAVYQYFNIDTLYAYKVFQEKLIQCVDEKAYSSGAKGVWFKAFIDGGNNAITWLHNQEIDYKEKGYYNNKLGLARRMDEGTIKLEPKKPLSTERFVAKYGDVDCEKILKTYLYEKYEKKEVNMSNEKSQEQIEYKYNGKKYILDIEEKNYYTDKNGTGIVSIKASSNDGYLFISYLNDGSVYTGDLYDLDGVLVEENGASTEFYLNEKYSTHLSKENKPQEKPTFNGQECPVYDEEKDQISLL